LKKIIKIEMPSIKIITTFEIDTYKNESLLLLYDKTDKIELPLFFDIIPCTHTGK